MSVNELLDLICESLEIETGTLTLETTIESVEEWNSVGWLTIMSEVDERFGIQMPSKEIRAMKTVADLVNYIGARAEITA